MPAKRKKVAEKIAASAAVDDRCTHRTYVSLHKSIVIGGYCVGRCENQRFPGMVVCYEHANKEGLAYMVRTLLADFERETGHPHSFVAGRTKRDDDDRVSGGDTKAVPEVRSRN